jgi:hypothetical protein
MDSFKYDKEKGLSMYAPDRQTNEPIQEFEKEDDDQDVKGDREIVEG